ncbi:cation-dependent mannose-6-phosphate receptor [Sphaerodactylus townsendi]|uniref:cation-dependent mannose-6-phosphate receptor n=1 Tax=Sphaerodactylus townsendi TaxID=933632 RepID=UPI002026A59D|nr:cation-dependent mannose-6-phosphate receptor [Sphaerodactylus townsendi]XP_048359992.1 cation-dependent mannose-6-phosphate receptor [Sphaerodactylus townsendi]
MFLGRGRSLARSCLPSVLLVLATAAMAGANGCDPVGKKGSESSRELALLKRLDPLLNHSFTTIVENATEKYKYVFQVCRGIADSGNTSGLVQIDEKNRKTTVVGRITETHVTSGTEWIMLTYKGGDKYGSHCGNEKRKAMVMITCNRKTLAGDFTMVGEEREKEEECFYLFELESSVACPPVDSHLSVGSILLITFVSLVGVYLIGGFLYQRLVVGAKGMEQFPHFAFWQDMGNLVADGCDFVCRSKPRNVPNAYRGVGDDQLGEEPEERDDHLLPM